MTRIILAAFLAAACGLAGCGEQPADGPQQAKVAYVASVNRAPFHRTACQWADRISPQNLRTFTTREQAIKAGHRPCKVCKP
jgi:micrococcal nuclease